MKIQVYLFQRTVKKGNKKIKCWYYWFWLNGKQVRRTCGKNGEPCLTKKEAQAFIANLKDEDLDPTLKAKEIENHITLKDFAAGMFDDNSRFLIKLKNKGKTFSERTLYQKRLYLSYIIDRFGSFEARLIEPMDIDNWLMEMDCSNSQKNQIITIFRNIYHEMYMYKIINRIPLIDSYAEINEKEKGILTPEEIKMLFPSTDYNEILSIWNKFHKTKSIPEPCHYMFATMIFVILSTGMRSGEARALQWNQFLTDDVIVLNAMMNSKNERIDQLKKGSKDNRKWRFAILPEKAKQMIAKMKTLPIYKKTDYVFELNGSPIDTQYLDIHFKAALCRNGINVADRNITIHSLRFTYNTMSRRKIEDDKIRLMLGHDTANMTDYYDKSLPVDHLPELLNQRQTINELWN